MIKNSLDTVYHYLLQQTQDASHQITLFGIVMMINYPLFGLVWTLESARLNEEFFLRCFATLLCAVLALNQYWPKSVLKFLPVFWYVVLLFCLPYFFCYLTLMHHGATVWLINCVSAIFFLLLVTSVLGSLILLFLGVGFAYVSYYFLSGSSLFYTPGHISLLSITFTYAAALLIGALFARDKEVTHAGRLLGLKMLAGSIAHDLRTPLASIHLHAEIQETILNKLNNLELQKDLKENLNKIHRSIEISNQLISMQLHNIQQSKINTQSFVIHSIKQLLNNTLNEYPLIDNQKNLILLTCTSDFCIWIDELAFKNLLWNLLKNSLEFIVESGKGNISIWIESGIEPDNFNYLHIKDTAKGLYAKKANKIFESFYSERPEGTGLGLSYCKQLMHSAGGDIFCKGYINEFAHFTLKFPKVD